MPALTDLSLESHLALLGPETPAAVVRDGPRTVLATRPSKLIRLDGRAALDALEGLREGWWAGFLSYDLGRAVERVPTLRRDDVGLPDLLLARFESRLIFEPGRRAVLEGADPDLGGGEPGPGGSSGEWMSSLDRSAFEAAVEEILEHLAAGDCYQVNLTRRLERRGQTDPVALYRHLAQGNPAPHEALIRLDGVAVVSASPELFLRVEGREVVSRPIKGTGSDADLLAASAKDRAENVMIVDLARNDLGRVCVTGSVRAPQLCRVEAHPGLFHLVSTVAGTLRDGVGWGSLIAATFPPASITGAPKPRVMEIIETLEPVRRGVYCGAVGFIDAGRSRASLNVAIRTFTMASGRTFFGVGGGIVADSRPGAEWEETELKARRLLKLASDL